jgi:hypothetical protein
MYHLGISFIIINLMFLCKTSSYFTSLKFFDCLVSFSFNSIDLFGIDDFCSIWNLFLSNFGIDSIVS